jgi:ribonuclease HI
MKSITIYTDGGCDPNPGLGGWGVVLLYKQHRKELYGGEKATTNNRMELIAAIEGLRALTEVCEVLLYTDSEYLRNGITTWIAGWKRNGWRTANKEPVKNQVLWQTLDELCQKHVVQWKWVKGHAGTPENERCDQLARMGRQKALASAEG